MGDTSSSSSASSNTSSVPISKILTEISASAPSSIVPALNALSRYAAGEWPDEKELSALPSCASSLISAINASEELSKESWERLKEVEDQRAAASASLAALAEATDRRLSSSEMHTRVERLESQMARVLEASEVQAETSKRLQRSVEGLLAQFSQLTDENSTLRQRITEIRYTGGGGGGVGGEVLPASKAVVSNSNSNSSAGPANASEITALFTLSGSGGSGSSSAAGPLLGASKTAEASEEKAATTLIKTKATKRSLDSS